ncbi:MAG: nitrogen fixation protein FixH [Aquabacterium sp.]|nr:nitrogen fixation protein FixH [Aquabacterium sp.]
MSQQSASDQVRPWWRYPIVWMVIGGPAIVVVASFVTLGLALKHGDPVLDTSGDYAKARNEAPAMQGRNHAAERPNQTLSR